MQSAAPGDAIAMFDRYARGGRSPQVATKGYYWAGRAAAQAGRWSTRPSHFERAAATPEQFYGQLALERLGPPVPRRPRCPSLPVTAAAAQRLQQKRLVRAVRLLGQLGQWTDQILFVRALSEVDRHASRALLAAEFGDARSAARISACGPRARRATPGDAFYTRAGFPTHALRAQRAHLVAGPRHHPPGKLVRPGRGQPRRRARA